ncbi:MAG: sulfatase family protein [Planctomycetota bacterium]|jgi:arylsulfatase A-like enzyme
MSAKSSAPNIVFVHVDQMRHDAISALGNQHVHTPNIDRLMADGTSFLRSYSANPVCCPARASWYTGRASSEHGVIQNQRPLLESVPDLGQWMGERGYACFYAGKWHIPNRRVDKSFTLLPGGYGHGEKGDPGVASVAAGFLHNYDRRRPFFLNVGFLNPHDCCYLTFAPKNPSIKFDLCGMLRDELPPAPGSFNVETGATSREGGRWDKDKVRLYNYYYYRMVEMVDAEVGRVYDALRHSRHAQNTLFILTSDHGEMGGHHDLFKKGVFYDAALRVPLVCVFGGRVKAGRRDSEHLVSGLDIPATILDYAGLEPMPGMTVAESLRPLLEAKPTNWRDYVVAESNSAGGPHRAVCMRDYKAVLNQDGSASLHNLKADPLEMQDLSEDPKHAEVLRRARDFHNDYVDRIVLHPKLRSFGKV